MLFSTYRHLLSPFRFPVLRMSVIFFLLLILTATNCTANRATLSDKNTDDFGVMLMAHGGSREWNNAVLSAVEPLQGDLPIEVAFGMADAVRMQKAVQKLEERGVRRIGVVRLFVSGESWYERTRKILGISPGAPSRPEQDDHAHHGGHSGHSMEFWKIDSNASFALTTQGLAEAEAMGAVLVDRARTLSQNPQHEDLLILAHGPEDDDENKRWLAFINARADAVREALPFRRVEVMTLREDWPEKREQAERRIREFVKRAQNEDGTAIVIPFRVHGFGPYKRVLEGLDYIADGRGLIPHAGITQWIAEQIELLRKSSFESRID